MTSQAFSRPLDTEKVRFAVDCALFPCIIYRLCVQHLAKSYLTSDPAMLPGRNCGVSQYYKRDGMLKNHSVSLTCLMKERSVLDQSITWRYFPLYIARSCWRFRKDGVSKRWFHCGDWVETWYKVTNHLNVMPLVKTRKFWQKLIYFDTITLLMEGEIFVLDFNYLILFI